MNLKRFMNEEIAIKWLKQAKHDLDIAEKKQKEYLIKKYKK